jgi:DNA-directed RNA polymerase subunit M/transcription elongation factor TFIIS
MIQELFCTEQTGFSFMTIQQVSQGEMTISEHIEEIEHGVAERTANLPDSPFAIFEAMNAAPAYGYLEECEYCGEEDVTWVESDDMSFVLSECNSCGRKWKDIV